MREKNRIMDNLKAQAERILKHCNENSYKTRYRQHYQTACRFCSFLADEHRLQKLANECRTFVRPCRAYDRKGTGPVCRQRN